MFNQLSEKLQKVFKNLRGYGKLSEKNINDALREIRIALLEADVHYSVVKDFLNRIKEKAMGQEVLSSITPGQQVVKVVHDELVHLLGDEAVEMVLTGNPVKIMLVGLQGAGKTTTVGKLAAWLEKKGRKSLLVACDTQRPAAKEQLRVLASQGHFDFFTLPEEKDPLKIVKQAEPEAKEKGSGAVLLDTAGRLHIDESLMDELKQIKEKFQPDEILFVADSMTGQDAVQSAKNFDEQIGITGVVLTKLDGDSRGGAALSIRWVTGKPIKFCGVGERQSQFEPFFPDRMASRILGMGDIVSLVEKAQETVDQEEALKWQQKLEKAEFSLEDFLSQMHQIKKMGPLKDLLGMMPGMGQMGDLQVDEKEIKRIEAIILSMTRKEREKPAILDLSRRQRVALGSGTSIQEVGSLLKRFQMTKKMMKQAQGMGQKLKKGKGFFKPGKLPFR